MASDKRYLSVEAPDTSATVDFMGAFPVTVRVSVVKGELRVYAVSATQDAPILVDEVATIPEADGDEDE